MSKLAFSLGLRSILNESSYLSLCLSSHSVLSRKTIMSENFINFMSLGNSLTLIGFESVVIAEPLWVSTQMKTTFSQCDEM